MQHYRDLWGACQHNYLLPSQDLLRISPSNGTTHSPLLWSVLSVLSVLFLLSVLSVLSIPSVLSVLCILSIRLYSLLSIRISSYLFVSTLYIIHHTTILFYLSILFIYSIYLISISNLSIGTSLGMRVDEDFVMNPIKGGRIGITIVRGVTYRKDGWNGWERWNI